MSFRGELLKRGMNSNGNDLALVGGDLTVNGTVMKETVVTVETLAAGRSLTAAEVIGGLIQFDPDSVDRIVTFPTAALLKAYFKTHWAYTGSSFECVIENTGSAGEQLLLAAGAGNTMDPTAISINAGEMVKFLFVFTSAGATPAVTVYKVGSLGGGGGTVDDYLTVTTIATDANVVLTADQVIGGLIIRGPLSAVRTDTFPSAATMIAAMSDQSVGATCYFHIRNISVLAAGTLLVTGGAGITYDPVSNAVISKSRTGRYAFRITGAATGTVHYLGNFGTAGTFHREVTTYSTAGNLNPITAAMLVDGVYNRDPNGADRTDTTATATQILEVIGDKTAGSSFAFQATNTADADIVATTTEYLTLASGVGVTFKQGGTTVTTVLIRPGETARFDFICANPATPTFDAHLISLGSGVEAPAKATLKSAAMTAAATLSVDEVLSGLVVKTPNASWNLTMPTAELLAAGVQFRQLGSAIPLSIRNDSITAGDVITLVAGVGNTLSPTAITVHPGQICDLLVVPTVYLAGTAAVTYYRKLVVPVDEIDGRLTVVADATAGALTVTAAMIAGGWLNRDCAGASRTDVTDTALLIIAGLKNPAPGSSFRFILRNTSDAEETITLTGGAGVTLDPTTITVKSGWTAEFLGRIDTSTAVTLYEMYSIPTNPYEDRLTVTTDSTVGALIITAAMIDGGWLSRDCAGGDRTDTTDTAANIIAVLDNPAVGTSFDFRIANTSDAEEAITLAAGAGVTLSPATIVIRSGQVCHLVGVITAAATITFYEDSTLPAVQCASVFYPNPIATETISIVAQVQVANGAQVIAGQPDFPRSLNMVITDANNSITAGTATYVGVNADGDAVNEVIDFGTGAPGTATYDTDATFATVTSITVAGLTGGEGADNIEVGVIDEFGLPTRPGGRLVGVYKASEDSVNVAIGTVEEDFNKVASTAAANAALDFAWWYKYV